MPFNVGPMEVIIVLAVALIILGPKRLPDAGRALGSGIRNFRRSLTFDTPAERSEQNADELTAGPAPSPRRPHDADRPVSPYSSGPA
jgi:sec-independent protein translocase protein TatA